MRRIHLFEWEDQPWCPRALRDAGTAYLRVAARVSGQTAKLSPKLVETLDRTGETRIVDLCSGGGGPLPELVATLVSQGRDVRATLTDLYPNRAAFASVASDPRVTVWDAPVDATAVPDALPGLRTLFNSFHHLRPAAAKAVLADAARSNRPIAVFELVGRTPPMLLGMVFSPIGVLLLMPLTRPLRPAALIFTYLIPLLILLVLWDGIVSCLRVYSPRELAEMTASIDAPPGYTWDIGTIPMGPPGMRATYLIGRPNPEP